MLELLNGAATSSHSMKRTIIVSINHPGFMDLQVPCA